VKSRTKASFSHLQLSVFEGDHQFFLIDANASADQRPGIQEAQSHVAEAAKHLKETDVPLTHGYARLVINRTIDELHAILNCLDDAVVAAKD